MWLVVLAPTVSHLVHASQDLVLPICLSASGPDGQHTVLVERIHVGEHHDARTDLLSACGYCDLLEHNAVLLSVPPPQPTVTPLLLTTLVTPLGIRFTPTGAFPSGRPRGPPLLS
nr:DUF2946 domain-containing protein [Pollutimonas bauzanensis]